VSDELLPGDLEQTLPNIGARIHTELEHAPNEKLGAFEVCLEYDLGEEWATVAVIPHSSPVRDNQPDIYETGLCIYQYRDGQIRYMRRELESDRIANESLSTCALLAAERFIEIGEELIREFEEWHDIRNH